MSDTGRPSAGRTDAEVGSECFASSGSTRTRTERALRDQQLLLASVLDNLPLGVGVYDQAGVLVHSNERMRDYAGLGRLPAHKPEASARGRGYDADGHPIAPPDYPGARALRGEAVTPGIDFLYGSEGEEGRWLRVSAVPFHREGDDMRQAIVVVQDVDDLKRAAERIEAAGAELASQSRLLDATLSSIPDFVYAFDLQHRFVYANRATLALFGLSADEIRGRTLADLGYPAELAEHLNRDIGRVLRDGVTVEDEVFYRSPTGYDAFFGYLWGPVRGEDGAVELVVGVSRDTSERHAFEEALKTSEARLRAATELVGLGIYSWDPVTGALEWDARLRAMWGLASDAVVDTAVYEAGIHPEDLSRVQEAIAACVDPAGDGRYGIEYRVIGRDDHATRHIATSGRTTFADGHAIGFIGAAIDVTAQRRSEAAIRASEAQFRGFAENSSNLMWIADPATAAFIYRSAAFERIWGAPVDAAPTRFEDWMRFVHRDDRARVERAMASVRAGDVEQYEYRICRFGDGAMRWLRDTSFPIRDEHGEVTRIGGIAEDLTQEDGNQVYIVSTVSSEARKLAALIRDAGYRARTFGNAPAFLDIAPVLAPGCVLVDLRKARQEGLSIPRELKARAIALPTIALDEPSAGAAAAVAAMKAGALDYLTARGENALRATLTAAMADCHGAMRPTARDESAGARIARLTPREREVLLGLVEGGTNKVIGQKLGISPRTVELHRAQVMNRLNASNLTELLQIALIAGITPQSGSIGEPRKLT